MAHEWDEDGERCRKCGDKDWFAGSTCSGDSAINIVPDSKCRQGKCAYTTTGCSGECKADQIKMTATVTFGIDI